MRSYLVATVGILFWALPLSTPASAEPVEIEDVSQRLFLDHCSSCHGSDGKGRGPVTAVLNVNPTDLTQISKQHGGTFPYADVFRVLDGRDTPRAHGNSAMPVWGEVFRAEPSAPLSEQLAGAGRLMLITLYLESIQEK